MSLKKLGRYELVRILGKGAMGIVYEGRDPNLERRVAIKTVNVENLSADAAAEYEARFRTEARSAARLQHPNIVSVYDSDRDGDTAFMVMEYIQGDDLKNHLGKGARYSLEQTFQIINDLLSALEYAHQQGVVHRDIKPANLLIEEGSARVKLTDFGVARIQDSGEATRTQGSMIGTLKYMAPEQVQGQKVDSRVDLFSAGVVLYQLLTDKRPFDADNEFSIIHQIIGYEPPPPSSINTRLPAAIDAVVARALAKDREQRFANARDFASALQSAVGCADDVSVSPPADPLKKVSASGDRSMDVLSAAAMGATGADVTQELELVYWKDIRESMDCGDFEAFLDKFPAGIYADLARRRLQKLTGIASSLDQTILDGVSTTGTRAPSEAGMGGPAAEPAPEKKQVKRPKAVLAAAGGLLLAVLVAFLMVGRHSESPQRLADPTPAVVAAAAPGDAEGRQAQIEGGSLAVHQVQPVAANSAAIAAVQSKASAPIRTMGPAKTKASAPALMVQATAAPVPPSATREEAPNPVEACKGKVFLSREFCLADACEKPAARNHALCVSWREDKRLREESKVR